MKKLIACALAALLLSSLSARAAEFSDDAFCTASKQAAANLKADGPKWVDQVTRSDGMNVDCDGKTVEFKKYLKLNAADMQHGWEDQMQQAWDQMYCQDLSMVNAMSHGWTITVTTDTADGTTLPVTVHCER